MVGVQLVLAIGLVICLPGLSNGHGAAGLAEPCRFLFQNRKSGSGLTPEPPCSRMKTEGESSCDSVPLSRNDMLKAKPPCRVVFYTAALLLFPAATEVYRQDETGNADDSEEQLRIAHVLTPLSYSESGIRCRASPLLAFTTSSSYHIRFSHSTASLYFFRKWAAGFHSPCDSAAMSISAKCVNSALPSRPA